MSQVETSCDLYYRMLLIRHFEETIAQLFSEGQMSGTCHLAIGQEACAVGATAALAPGDLVVSNHRGHGHALAKGADPSKMMAEILGRKTGYCRGKGGSQHMCAMDVGFLGTNGITGGGIPIATGAGLSALYRGSGQVVMCFFGDGASNQGTFHESLNMAGIWRLPVVYFCENNLYAMSMHVSASTASKSIAGRASSYGMKGVEVDGMDVLAVRDAAYRAVDAARAGSGPILIEAKTYRFSGHSKSDQRIYRTKDEEAEWLKKDPLTLCRRRLVEEGVDSKELDAVERKAIDAMVRAADFASKSEYASEQETMSGVYA